MSLVIVIMLTAGIVMVYAGVKGMNPREVVEKAFRK